MFSILIPTHDYTCYKLVYDLHRQAEALGVPYEIIVAEDGSKDQVSIIANHKIVDMSNCKHLVRKENTGQAILRNELAALAQYEWIIFIDSDAVVDSETYLSTYFNNIEKAEVVVGGLKTPAQNYDPNKTLRHKYETTADRQRDAATRMKNPYMHLTCFNAMLRRDTFLQVRFNENCHEYGYEDALFGVELEKRGISILHIDNPLVHNGLDTNEAFLRKSETALRTLKSLNGQMCGHCHVENIYNRLKSLHLTWGVQLFHLLFGGLIRKHLLSAHNPSLTLFALYKLGYYATLH